MDIVIYYQYLQMDVRTNQKVAAVGALFYLIRKCLRLVFLIKNAYKKRMLYQKLPMMNVSEVIDYLKTHPTVKSIDCFIQGLIKSDTPFTSIYNKAQKLVFNIVVGSYVYSNNPDEIVDSLDFRNKFVAVKPKLAQALKLYDLSDQSVYGNVKLLSDASLSLALSEIHKQSHEVSIGWIGKIWMVLAELLKRGLFFVGRFVKGSKYKIVKEELGIKQSQFVNVSAQCSIIKDNLVIYVNNVVKQSFMFHQKIMKTIRGYKLSLLFFSIVTIIYIFLARRILRSVYNNIKDYLKLQFPNLFNDQIQTIDNQQQDSQDGEFNCNVCYSKVRSVILKPCKHYGLCIDCYRSVQYACPYCKTEIEGAIEVKKLRQN